MLSRARLGRLLQGFWHFLQHVWSRHRSALLLLLLGVFFPLTIFGNLAEDVWENEGGFPWDVPILLAIRQTANPFLDQFAIAATHLGVFWGVFPLSVLLSWFLLKRRCWRSLAYLVITLLGSIVLNRAAKTLLRRVRPQLWVSPAPEFDYGFPSGHAMSSMVFVTVLVILSWHTRWRWPVIVGGTLFVLLIGWTRLYLGVHYPSDILAGWAASIAWAVGVSLILKPNLNPTRPSPNLEQVSDRRDSITSDRHR